MHVTDRLKRKANDGQRKAAMLAMRRRVFGEIKPPLLARKYPLPARCAAGPVLRWIRSRAGHRGPYSDRHPQHAARLKGTTRASPNAGFPDARGSWQRALKDRQAEQKASDKSPPHPPVHAQPRFVARWYWLP